MEKSQKTLEELNNEAVEYDIGGFIFIGILMIIGIIGNLHVLYVYVFRIKNASNHRTFILMLGLVDFITCVTSMPLVMVHLRRPLTLTQVYVCKWSQFVYHCNFGTSMILLLIIAVDRYRKICFPLNWQISHRASLYLGICAFIVGLMMSWPAVLLYGHNTVMTSVPNITGVRCYAQDSFLHTNYPTIFNAVLMFITCSITLTLIVLYSQIGRVIAKHKGFIANFKPTLDAHRNEVNISTVIKSERKLNTNQPDICDIKKVRRFIKAEKTTIMFFLITAVFAISIVPYFMIRIISYVNSDFRNGMTFTEKALFNTFRLCPYLNNVSNCFIYGFYYKPFRTEVKLMYNRSLVHELESGLRRV